jgi:hypothetical protein
VGLISLGLAKITSAPSPIIPAPIKAGASREDRLLHLVNQLKCTLAAKGAIAPCSWTAEESEVECSEHQDNADIHCQPFPKSVSEERDIYADYDGCHRHRVKHSSYLSAHFSQPSLDRSPCFSTLPKWVEYYLGNSFSLPDAAAGSSIPRQRRAQNGLPCVGVKLKFPYRACTHKMRGGHVRCSPKSGRGSERSGCPFCAISDHSSAQNTSRLSVTSRAALEHHRGRCRSDRP